MKLVATALSKKHISSLKEIFDFCGKNDIKELVILLAGDINGQNSIVEKEGLSQLIETLKTQTKLCVHLVREGLGYNLSVNDYNAVFKDTNYGIEPTYHFMFHHLKVNFYSNSEEDFYWNDEHFSELYTTDLKVSATYFTDEGYGKSAWQLSKETSSKLLYLEEGDTVLFDDLCVYKILSQELLKIKDYSC